MNLQNLTPHDVRIRLDTSNEPIPLESDIVLPKSGTIANLREEDTVMADLVLLDKGAIPVVRTVLGDIENLPPPQEGTIYIVSMPCAQRAAAMGRTDCASPNTSRASLVKTATGAPYAVRGVRFF